jgi:hypothetical protein
MGEWQVYLESLVKSLGFLCYSSRGHAVPKLSTWYSIYIENLANVS